MALQEVSGRRTPPRTRRADELEAEQLELISRWKATKSPRLLEELVRSCRPLIASVVKRRYGRRGEAAEEYINFGGFGICIAAERYEPGVAKFSTYASWWIYGIIQREIRNTRSTIRLPVHVQEADNDLRRLQQEVEWELNTSSTIAQVEQKAGRRLDIREQFVLAGQNLTLPLQHMKGWQGEDRDTDTLPFLSSKELDPEQIALARSELAKLLAETAKLKTALRQLATVRAGGPEKKREGLFPLDLFKKRYGLEAETPEITLLPDLAAGSQERMRVRSGLERIWFTLRQYGITEDDKSFVKKVRSIGLLQELIE